MANDSLNPHSVPVVRPIELDRDVAALSSFVVARDLEGLKACRAAVEADDAFILVAELADVAVGWVAVHTSYRADQGWTPDEDTQAFQQGEHAYLVNIEVERTARGLGIGRMLLEAAEAEASRRGKRCLWLHTSEANHPARRLFASSGWLYEKTVRPPWNGRRPTLIYKKPF